MLRSAAWLRRRRHVTVTTTASTRVMTATQTTSDMNSVDSLLVDAATGWNLSLILSNSSDASAAELLSPALESSSAKHTTFSCVWYLYSYQTLDITHYLILTDEHIFYREKHYLVLNIIIISFTVLFPHLLSFLCLHATTADPGRARLQIAFRCNSRHKVYKSHRISNKYQCQFVDN